MTAILAAQGSPSSLLSFTISRAADWNDPLPPIVDADGYPIDLTGKTLRLYVRPSFDYSTALATLSSPSGGISIDDAFGGFASISYVQSSVAANLPAGRWQQFLVLEDGASKYELTHGWLSVHERKTS